MSQAVAAATTADIIASRYKMIGDIGSSAFGALGSFLGKSKDNAGALAAQQYNYQRLLNQQAYDLTQQGYRESPLNQRIGYESAGINPILAMSNAGASFGSYSGGSAGMPHGSSTADLGNMATNAYKVFSLMRNKNDAEIAGITAGIKNTNADTALKDEQILTERQTRLNMEMDRMIREADLALTNQHLSYSEKEWNLKLKEMAERAKNYNSIAQAQLLNAETNALLNAGNIEEAQRDAEWIRKHPILHSMGKWTNQATSNVGNIVGAGTNIYNAKSGRINANANAYRSSSDSYERYIQKYDSRGNYRGHTREVYNRR